MFKILVVEDDKELNRTVCSFLNQSGYEATGCLNGSEAYDALYENMFDLIVSDIMMPGVDGFELAKNVRELNKEIPILFMTARDDIASKQRGFRIGVDDYMVKPINVNEMVLRKGAYGGFFACRNYPECKTTLPIRKDSGVACPDCGKRIMIKQTKNRKTYYCCEAYPECSFSSWDLPTERKCPTCGGVVLKRKNREVYYCKNNCGWSEGK